MTGTPFLALALLAATFGLSWAGTRAALAYLRRHAILDHPNERSNHSMPTPRGGGWGILLGLLPAAALAGWLTDSLATVAHVLLGVALLVTVSWADDRRGLSPMLRLLCQTAAVALGLAALPSDALVFQGLLPYWLDRPVAALGWIWFVNLYNFMDGIDGLAGSETVALGLGIALVAAAAGGEGLDPQAWIALAAAGSALGFLVWNWHPARIFMGDVGSVPLGYLLGWLLLGLAAQGYWIAAVLLPGYFLADATWTLARRILQGKPVWQAHREHFYQRAVLAGRSHAEVVRAVLVANSALVLLALASPAVGWPALPLGGAAIAALIAWMRRPARPSPTSGEFPAAPTGSLRRTAKSSITRWLSRYSEPLP